MTGPWLIPGNVALECSLCYRLMMLVCTQKQHGGVWGGQAEPACQHVQQALLCVTGVCAGILNVVTMAVHVARMHLPEQPSPKPQTSSLAHVSVAWVQQDLEACT